MTVDAWLAEYGEASGKRLIYVHGDDMKGTSLTLLQARGIEAIQLEGAFDLHFIQFLEQKSEDVKWVRADAVLGDLLTRTEDSAGVVDADGRTLEQRVEERFREAIGEDGPPVKVVRLDTEDVSALLISGEEERRMAQWSSMWGQGMAMPEQRTLLVHRDHPLVSRALSETGEQGRDICRHIYDLARLSVGALPPDALPAFISRSQSLLL